MLALRVQKGQNRLWRSTEKRNRKFEALGTPQKGDSQILLEGGGKMPQMNTYLNWTLVLQEGVFGERKRLVSSSLKFYQLSRGKTFSFYK